MMVATADHVARLTGSSTNRRSAMMPANANSRTAVVVSRGSQSHHTPQVGLAQIAPWQQSRKASKTLTSMAPSSLASHFQLLVNKKTIAQPKAKVMASRAFQPVGTWTYMM